MPINVSAAYLLLAQLPIHLRRLTGAQHRAASVKCYHKQTCLKINLLTICKKNDILTV